MSPLACDRNALRMGPRYYLERGRQGLLDSGTLEARGWRSIDQEAEPCRRRLVMISTPRLARRVGTLRTLPVFAVTFGTLILSACYTVKVQTLGRPSANFGQYRTFRILEAHRLEGAPSTPRGWAAEPMLNNS